MLPDALDRERRLAIVARLGARGRYSSQCLSPISDYAEKMSMQAEALDFTVARLGQPRIPSPVGLAGADSRGPVRYVSDSQRVAYNIQVDFDEPDAISGHGMAQLGWLERAGPREHIYFDPSKVHAGIVTCGGLCPGLNNVIRSIVMTLWYHYGVRRISGIRYGYHGLLPDLSVPVKDLIPDEVSHIHRAGGTILGSSRGGGGRVDELVDSMERLNLSMLFAIGGDGTQKGALAIANEIERRGTKMVVVGVPKTIDNDLAYVERSFGFETAVSQAGQAVDSANTEAKGAIHGIGLVKVMGRESGFIAAHAALASNDVNVVLVPEVPFDLDGERGLLAHLEHRLITRGHAVVLVAEGAGQHLVNGEGSDASGNPKFGDIGTFLRDRISDYFNGRKIESTVKYIDPSYIIRASPANPADAIYCARLGSNAVHAAMVGRTGCLVGRVNNRLVHVPIELATQERNRVNSSGPLWRDVLEATGQPRTLVNASGPAAHGGKPSGAGCAPAAGSLALTSVPR